MLWKASQISQMESSSINSWNLYKRWIDLEQDIRDTWIVAGETIQSFAKMGQGQMQEQQVKITKSILPEEELDDYTPATRKLEVTVMGSQQKMTPKILPKPALPTVNRAAPMSPQIKAIQRPGLTISKTSVPIPSPIKKPEPVILNKLPPNQIYHAKHFDSDTSTLKEYRVEKILAKRFNPRKKMHEYLVKWNAEEPLDSNTWEPQNHLDTCMPLLDIFETQLAKQKEARAKLQQAAFDQLKGTPAAQSTPRIPLRPAQSNVQDDGIKRKTLESDYDTTTEDESADSPALKRIRTEAGGRVIIRRTVNGQTMRSPASAEVVLTSPKDNKQSGVIKKPGATIISPRTEPAQVKILRKGETAESGVVRIVQQKTGSQVVTRTTSVTSPQPRQGTIQRIPAKVQTQLTRKVIPTSTPTTVGRTTVTRIGRGDGPKIIEQKIIAKPGQKGGSRVIRKPSSEDEDDGLPDLFPQEVKIPAPDSPERPLTLCPLTGKVLGRAEGEMTPPPEDEIKLELKQEPSTSKDEKQDEIVADTTIQQIMTNEDGSPLLVTGEDGTIYQVAGKNAEGQTILIAQGADGESQCLFVAADDSLNIIGGEAAEGEQVSIFSP